MEIIWQKQTVTACEIHERVSRTEAQALEAHSHLAEFLNAGTPEVVAAMGAQPGWDDRLAVLAACGLIGWALVTLLHLGLLARRKVVAGVEARVMADPVPFAGLVGWWQPVLVVSDGLLTSLSPAHLRAVILHEQGHRRYGDPFWFFWLGWLRRLMVWLPGTAQVWEQLLALREMRADDWAARQADRLVLAEALLALAPAPMGSVAAVGTGERLAARLEALLASVEPPRGSRWSWLWLSGLLLPVASVLLHSARGHCPPL